MKKHLLIALTILCCLEITAQTDGCLIVKEFSPDEWHELHERIYFDMDDDGEYDFTYQASYSSFNMGYAEVRGRNGSCFHVLNEGEIQYPHENTFVDFNQPLNDTSLRWIDPHEGTIICPEKAVYGEYHLDTMVYKAGIRNGQEGEYYYGWMEAYSVVSENYSTVYFHLARTCYCTIPNYPLRWGQTSLHNGFEETESTVFANIYPNPTNSLFTIAGEALRQAEVINTLGQQVAIMQGKGEMLQIDMANLPTGIYFVRITNEEGQKCVKKVVKE